MIILGIESSCDETAVAIVQDGKKLLANVVASSMDLHTAYGGVARKPQHAAILSQSSCYRAVSEFSRENYAGWDAIDGIAVAYGAGLSGSLFIGALTARTLAITKNKPCTPLTMLEGHVRKLFSRTQPQFLLLSFNSHGGHSQLVF